MSDWKNWTFEEWKYELKKQTSIVESIGHPILGYMPIQNIPIIGPIIAWFINIFWAIIENYKLARDWRRYNYWYWSIASPDDQKQMDDWIISERNARKII